MKVPAQLHVIVIDELTNPILIEHSWSTGDPVVREYTVRGGFTFERGDWDNPEAYSNIKVAQQEIDKRITSFVGLTFKIVSFVH